MASEDQPMTVEPAELERLRALERDAATSAALRLAFLAAAESARKIGWQRTWQTLYEAVRDNEAGVRLLARLTVAEAEVGRLQDVVRSLCDRIASQSELLTGRAERAQP